MKRELVRFKRFMIVLGIAGLGITSSAQSLQKGTLMVGGQLNLSGNTDDTFNPQKKSSNLNVGLQMSKAVKENGFLGATIFIAPTVESYPVNQPDDKLSYFSAGAGIFYTKFFQLRNRFYFFMQPMAEFSGSSGQRISKSGGKSPNSKGSSFSLSLSPGLSYSVTQKLMLHVTMPSFAAVGYYRTKYISTPSSYSSFWAKSSLNGGPLNSIGLGFGIIL